MKQWQKEVTGARRWQRYRTTSHSNLAWLWIPGLLSVLNLACPLAVPYEARQELVTTLGVPQTQQRLRETLLRSINPRVIDVNVTDDYLHYRYQQPLMGAYGVQTGVAVTGNRVYFRNISRVEVFDNHQVLVHAGADRIVAQVLFTSEQDAKTFADLMFSFHAHRTKDGA